MPQARTGYSAAQIALHWAVALLVISAFVTKDGASAALRSRMTDGADPALPLHAWLGIGVLLLTLVRLALRLTRGVPHPPASDPASLRAASIWGHRLIYALLIIVPVGGLFTWFSAQNTPHGALGMALVIVAFGHALVALAHHYLRRDGLLRRMMVPGD